MQRIFDALVIGGGSTGTSILYHLAKMGVVNSALVEKGSQIAIGQTSRSTGIIRTHYSHPTLAKMALLSLDYFKNFERNVAGQSSGFEKSGLLICSDERFDSGIHENLNMFRSLGINSRIVDRNEVGSIEPQLDSSPYFSFVYEPEAGVADPSLTCASFSSAARGLGAKILPNTAVTSIRRESREAYTVATISGEIHARNVIVALGPWTNLLLGKMGINLPIRAIRHPVVIMHRPNEYSGRRPIIFDFLRGAYFRPEGNHLLHVGDMDTAASKSQVDADNYDESVSFEEITRLAEWVVAALPVMRNEGTVMKQYIGIYDATPDEQPIIEEFSAEGFEGLYCIAGLSGHGFKLCPEFGRIISSLIVTGKFNDYDISIFSNDRFKQGKLLLSKYKLGTIG